MEIQNFRNAEFGSLRVIQNEKGEMMFCLADVCKALGIGNSRDVKNRLDSDDVDSIDVVTNTVNQYGECSKRYKMTFIGEPNLYRCIFQSKKDSAKRFQDWVFGEVLPSIRRTGAYMTRDTMLSVLAEPENILRLCRTLVEMQPKAEYCDAVLLSDDCMTMTQVAKELGMTCHDLTHYLLDNRVIYAQSGQYLLYADYARMGYAKNRTHGYRNSKNEMRTHSYLVWTERGRRFVHELLERVPIIHGN